MPDEIQVRNVTVEFLRPGPPHNQLLSPLTQYLAICGDAGAGVVTVPYEHAAFERKLKELRYETGDAGDRLAMLHDVGVEMGKILGAVPGLPGSLFSDANKHGTLVHLRLTLSASELAHLPFELAKGPVGPAVTSQSWLSIQTRPPVCLTRSIRTVSPEGVAWPDRPRVLFVSGDPAYVPFKEHRQALVEAIAGFQYPASDDAKTSPDGMREQFGSLLTVLKDPTLADVLAECAATPYTHVHLLTHGDQFGASSDSYGLVLRGPDDAPDVVSGERFASALTSVGRDRIHRPTVVTVASCDSANVGTVAIPGASFAHALHQSGIPLVVASQFPLSKEGSVPLVGRLYDGLLWGEHPLILLQQLRAELYARYTSLWHDWASIVVYEALPRALEDQLDSLRYRQAKRAMDAGLQRIDLAIQEPESDKLRALDKAIERAVARLPFNGQYAVECVGLQASSRKRRAQAAFALMTQSSAAGIKAWVDPFDLLEQAWIDYDRGVRGLLINEGRAVQRVATLHWVLVQMVGLAVVLGKAFDEERWVAAKLSADLYRDHQDPEQRAWAHGSLAELWMLKLCKDELGPEEARRCVQAALDNADELLRLYPARNEFPVISTLRQFQRYVNWWGHPAFVAGLERRNAQPRMAREGCLLLDTARKLIGKLERVAPLAEGGEETTSVSEAGRAPPATAAAPAAASPPQATPASRAAPRRRPAPPEQAARAGKFFDIEMLPAGHGDALWIEYGEGNHTHRWLIDCGTQQTAKFLGQRVEQVPTNERMLELFVMTHIDADHIGGALPFLGIAKSGLRFGDVWFNGWRHLSKTLGARQGEMFSSAIQDLELPWNVWRDGGAIVVDGDELPTQTLPGGMQLTLLSPTPAQLRKLAPVWQRELERCGLVPGGRVDYSRFLKGSPSTSTDVDALADEAFSGDAAAPNGSSIALLAEFGGAAALFGADAHVDVLTASLQRLLAKRGQDRLKLDAFKLAHHGSQNNLDSGLLQLVDCPRFLLSTNGDYFYHPDRQAVARAIKYGRVQPKAKPALYFNYRSQYNDVWARADLQERYGYAATYPGSEAGGLRVALIEER